jgi:hypothetical protein
MKLQPKFTFAAAIFLSFATFRPSVAQNGSVTAPPQAIQGPASAEPEAMQMVPARAALKEDLDGKKVQKGATFHAVLANKIRLKTGMELPGGTVLVGQVVEDEMQMTGTSSRLSLRFMTANLKNGQSIPIKATIVEIIRPESVTPPDSSIKPGDQAPNEWTARVTKVDQNNVVNGVDLHSAIASKDSGVLVSNNGKDVKLSAGSEFALAIATLPAAEAAAPASGMAP